MDIGKLQRAFGEESWWEREASNLFKSEPSFRWWIQRHRERLKKARALVRVHNQLYVNPPAMAEEAAKIFCEGEV